METPRLDLIPIPHPPSIPMERIDPTMAKDAVPNVRFAEFFSRLLGHSHGFWSLIDTVVVVPEV